VVVVDPPPGLFEIYRSPDDANDGRS
jgi:hypothetical protein